MLRKGRGRKLPKMSHQMYQIALLLRLDYIICARRKSRERAAIKSQQQSSFFPCCLPHFILQISVVKMREIVSQKPYVIQCTPYLFPDRTPFVHKRTVTADNGALSPDKEKGGGNREHSVLP